MEQKKHYWIYSWNNYYGRLHCQEADLTEEEAADYKKRGFSVFDSQEKAWAYECYRLTD